MTWRQCGRFSILAGLSLVAIWGFTRADVLPQAAQQIELRLELRQNGNWRPVDVHTVFHNRDEIRFTFKSTFPGYLKVVNHSSDGETAPLFPIADSKALGQVDANTNYLVPGSKGSFVVAGKPGFDLTEWLVSAAPLESGWETTAGPIDNTKLLPKCQHELLQPRRSCLDDRAGPAQSSRLPNDNPNGSSDQVLTSRDLNFQSRDLSAVITIPGQSRKLVVYEFRVAHN